MLLIRTVGTSTRPLARRLGCSCTRTALAAPPKRVQPTPRFCSSQTSASAPGCTVKLHHQHSKSAPVPEQTAPDHRTLGVRQELFTTSIYSPGSPIFLPNGTRIFNRLVEFLRKQYAQYGFEEVLTPTIYKKALWAKSGHLENYADDMFTVTSTSPSRADPPLPSSSDGEGAAAKESDEYGLKPMNCPGHCLIFSSQPRSYRDLPIRYADFSPLHRNEVSGALSGLTRVRRFHQDDGHIFCLPSQIEGEIRQTLDFVRKTYEALKLGPYRLVLSTRPADHFIGSPAEWDQAEAALRQALDGLGEPWTESPGDGAFYGPKIDIILRDSDGKEHQTATIQLDFQLPKRFELEYRAPVDPDAQESEQGSAVAEPPRPVLIHRAVLGSVERLMALLIEHYNGRWPFWLNPRQVMILAVNDSDPVVEKARWVRRVLLEHGPSASAASQLAVDIDDSSRTLPLKIREARMKGYGVIITVGPNELNSTSIPVEFSGTAPVGHDPAESQPTKRRLNLEPDRLALLLKAKIEAHE